MLHPQHERDTMPTELIQRYRELPFPSDHLGDCEENDEKIELLLDLEEFANDELVGNLLFDILDTPNEFDLARIEAIKIVGVSVDDSSPLAQKLRRRVWEIFGDRNEDTMVRQHASQNLCEGHGVEGELELIERVLFDEGDNIDVRHGAFSFVERAKNDTSVQQLIPKLRSHPLWSKYSGEL